MLLLHICAYLKQTEILTAKRKATVFRISEDLCDIRVPLYTGLWMILLICSFLQTGFGFVLGMIGFRSSGCRLLYVFGVGMWESFSRFTISVRLYLARTRSKINRTMTAASGSGAYCWLSRSVRYPKGAFWGRNPFFILSILDRLRFFDKSLL